MRDEMKTPNWLPDWNEDQFKMQVPTHLQIGMRRYFFDGVSPGPFLRAILSNDLSSAIASLLVGDLTELRLMITYLYNHAPSQSWGNAEKVAKWLSRKTEGFDQK